MKATLQKLKKGYKSALEEALAGGGEAALQHAYELVHRAVQDGLGLMHIVSIHKELLLALLSKSSTPEECVKITKATHELLTECLVVFEFTHRSFGENNRILQALLEGEKRLRELADAMPQLVWTANPEGRIDYFNRRLTEFRLQKGLKSAIHPEDWLRTREAWQQGIKSENGYEIEHRLRRADGCYRWFLSRAVPVHDEAGQVIKWYGTSTDVDDQKQAEQALQRSRDELEEKVRERTTELLLLLEDLEKSRKELRKLASELVLAEERERKRIATILHDEICQTLAVARMRVDMIQRMNLDEESQRTLKEAKDLLVESIRETRALMNDVGNPLLFDMGVKAACLSLTDRLMAIHPIQIQCDIRDSFKILDTDMKVILFQVIRELLNNVVKHSGARNAHVRIQMDTGQIRAEVRDDGRGFDPVKLGAPTAEGGFGLFSIRERLMAFDGSLQIESTPKVGTVVKATLPAGLGKSKKAGSVDAGQR